MQQNLKWRYYNRAVIPATAPHEPVDETALRDKAFWKSFVGRPILARWTSDFDCEEDTGWWYEIKDTPFDFAEVTANYRQKIRKGLKCCEIRIIEPTEYAEELFQVQVEAYSAFPPKYRPVVDHDQFVESLKEWNDGPVFAAFCKEEGCIAGYIRIIEYGSYVTLSVLRANPAHERTQVNAGLIHTVLTHYEPAIANGLYVLAGERCVLHETNFQSYVEKYFAFRKAYCHLHLQYRPCVKPLVGFLYAIRGLLARLNGINIFWQINGVLKMEEIARRHRKQSQAKEV